MFFFFNDTATTEIYTLSLHDALPISAKVVDLECVKTSGGPSLLTGLPLALSRDRKSTRLNSSHTVISYAVFCLKKKKKKKKNARARSGRRIDITNRVRAPATTRLVVA